jgi:tRNA A22 N-methylase
MLTKNNCHTTAIRYPVNRMNTYPITEQSILEEKKKINEILKNNNYKKDVFRKREKQLQKQDYTKHTSQKWATFTYIGK